MKYSFLVENKTDNPGIMAEHGLSLYIETHGRKLLFDAGATDLVVKNGEEMGIDLSDVDLAVVSHGHYDHTGGFPAFAAINHKAPVYIHKNAFRESYGFDEGKPEKETSGIRWTDDQRAALEERLVLTDGPVMITEDICITGTVVCDEAFVPTEHFYYRDETGSWVEDDMSHEQCLVIREPEGLYVFSGCSHRGVVSALNTAKSLFPGQRVAALVAGMHLYSASAKDRAGVVEQVAAENLDCVVPVHCTGIKAICDLKSKLGDVCVVATAGDEFHGKE